MTDKLKIPGFTISPLKEPSKTELDIRKAKYLLKYPKHLYDTRFEKSDLFFDDDNEIIWHSIVAVRLNEPKDIVTIKDLAVVVTTNKGTCHQVALTKEMTEALISDLRMMYFSDGKIKISSKELQLDIVENPEADDTIH